MSQNIIFFSISLCFKCKCETFNDVKSDEAESQTEVKQCRLHPPTPSHLTHCNEYDSFEYS